MCQFFIQEVISQLWNDNVALRWQTLSLKTQLQTIKQGGKYKLRLQVSRQNSLFFLFPAGYNEDTHRKKSLQNTN